MPPSKTSSGTQGQRRIRRLGLGVAAVGLVIGGFALNQCLTTVVDPIGGASTNTDWMIVEGMTCAVMTALGFALMVLGAEHWEDEDHEHRNDGPRV